MDDFIYFTIPNSVEQQFKAIISQHIKVSFMGVVNWFLGTNFYWACHADNIICVHLSQAAFAQNLVEHNKQKHVNFNPTATPHRSGLPMTVYYPIQPNPTWKQQEMNQSLVCSFNWLVTCTWLDLSTVSSNFLSGITQPQSICLHHMLIMHAVSSNTFTPPSIIAYIHQLPFSPQH